MRKLTTTLSLVALLIAGAAQADWDAGVAAFKAGNYAEAVTQFKTVVEAQPEFAGGHLMLGNAYLKAKQPKQAVPQLQKALELNQGDAQTTVLLGQALLQSGNYSDCYSVLGKANVAGMPKALQTAAYQIKGACANKSGGDASEELKKVAQMKPDDAAAQYAYGASSLQNEDMAAAIPALAKAVALDGSNPQYLDTYVNALKRQARSTRGAGKVDAYKKALQPAQKLASVQANFDNVLQLGEVQMGAKMYDQAISNFNKAAGMKASDFLPLFYVGQSYAASGRFVEAEAPLQKALGLASAPDAKKQVQNQLGYVFAKQNKYDEAIAAYNAAGNSNESGRVAENKRIAAENAEADRHNAEIEQLKAEQERLRREAEALPGAGDPPR